MENTILNISAKDVEHHTNIKENNEKYPKMPDSVLTVINTEEPTINQIKHANSCLMGFNSRLHNYHEDLSKSMVTEKQEHNPGVMDTLETYWGEN